MSSLKNLLAEISMTRAYQRSDFFAQRKAVHEAWGRYLFGA